MSLTLHLGVVDVPYSNRTPTNPKRLRNSLGPTTGDVAEILEDKYHVIELFVEEVGTEAIQKALAHSMEGALESIALGAPPNMDIAKEATDEIEAAFRHFIDQQELDGIVPGVPTKAALKGVNHRLAHPYASTNPSRPSFRDTGLYQQSFKAWVEYG